MIKVLSQVLLKFLNRTYVSTVVSLLVSGCLVTKLNRTRDIRPLIRFKMLIPVPLVGDFLNRPPQFCRELTESFDWYILFDIHTDQLLVLDLSIGWYDIKRLSFYVHQQSLHQGKITRDY